jgi:hypothetical protein
MTKVVVVLKGELKGADPSGTQIRSELRSKEEAKKESTGTT